LNHPLSIAPQKIIGVYRDLEIFACIDHGKSFEFVFRHRPAINGRQIAGYITPKALRAREGL